MKRLKFIFVDESNKSLWQYKDLLDLYHADL